MSGKITVQVRCRLPLAPQTYSGEISVTMERATLLTFEAVRPLEDDYQVTLKLGEQVLGTICGPTRIDMWEGWPEAVRMLFHMVLIPISESVAAISQLEEHGHAAPLQALFDQASRQVHVDFAAMQEAVFDAGDRERQILGELLSSGVPGAPS